MSIQTGALWNPARLAEAGFQAPEGGHKCPLCGEPNTDEGHLFWQCPQVCQNRDAAIQKTNRYRSEYQRVGLDCKCYWWRGLQPRAQTLPIHQPQASYHMLGRPIDQYRDEHIEIFTDGSGGRHSSDARLRRCAWAWVCPKEGSNREALHGARGSLGGKQTVPRAELTAIHECLSDLQNHPMIKHITIHSDCKMAVDSYAKGKTYSQLTACGAIWADIWKVVEILDQQGIKVEIKKVKAHTEDDNIAAPELRRGNQCADHHAGLAVVEVPASEAASIGWMDRKLRAIQERMIIALQMLPRRGRHPQEATTLIESAAPKQRRDAKIGPAQSMGHSITRRGPMLECDKCGLFWLSANTDQILSRGPCLGHNTYGEQPQDLPWVIPPNGAPLVWGEGNSP